MPVPVDPFPPRLVGDAQAAHDPRADTHDGTPGGAVLTSRGETELRLTWPAAMGATGYRIKFNGGAAIAATPGQLFGGFARDTAINVEVQAFNNEGDSGFSPTRTFFTRPAQPPHPANLDGFSPAGPLADPRADVLDGSVTVANSRGPDFLRLAWTPAPGATGYEVRLNGGNFQAVVSGVPVTGLAVNSQFNIELTSIGNGGRSFRMSSVFWTRPDTPERPTLVGTNPGDDDPKVDVVGNSQVVSRMENGFHLTWQPKPSAISHEIQVEGGQFMAIAPGDTLTNRSPGNSMEPNVSYSLNLTALGNGGRSFRSSRVIFTRPPVPTGLLRTRVDAFLEGIQFYWNDSGPFPGWGGRKWDAGSVDPAVGGLPAFLLQGFTARSYTDFAFPRIPTSYFVRMQVGDNASLWTPPLLVRDLNLKTAGYHAAYVPAAVTNAGQATLPTSIATRTTASGIMPGHLKLNRK